MTTIEATVATTAVPMQGYEEALLGAEVSSTRLHELSHALQARGRSAPVAICLRDSTRVGTCGGRSWSVKEALPPIQCFILESGWDSAPEPEDDRPFECEGYGYLDAVRSAYLSFVLAAIKACAKGESTGLIVLRGQAGLGGKIDLRWKTWISQCQGEWGLASEQDCAPTLSRSGLDVQAFLEEVYDLGTRDLQTATDRVFDTIDRLLCDGREEVCDQILARVEVARLPTALLRSFLTITAPAKGRLPSRPAFYARAYSELERQRGPDMAKRLLGRLA
jgi:hypothetical protein